MTSPKKPDPHDLLADLIAAAKAAGADQADALMAESVSSSVSYRLGKLEEVERAEGADLGLRVFLGQRVAFVSSTDFSREGLAALPGRAVAMARLAPEDRFACLAPADMLARHIPELDLADTAEPSAEALVERARAVEEAAMAVPGITNSEGGSASFSKSVIALATSAGFYGRYAASSHSFGVSVLAGEGTGMERDYDYSSARHLADLEAADVVGRRAGERTVKRLGARKIKSQSVPVVFDPRESASLLGHLAGAISGSSVARGVSFLKDSMGKAIFAPGVGVTDDPHRARGLRSKPFDGEGVANSKKRVIADGVLQSWLLDCASAKQLGLATTGHAARGTGGPPHPAPTNLYMEPGALAPADLIADIKEGLYVTELIGMGVNIVTGDYSRGAGGFWIENGKIAYPVSEVTIAGHLTEMFRMLTPADDLVFRYGTDAPTCRIDGMTVAGA